mmetsp:Transcript_42267/g.128223  ORF Transcript_42267/g.128223 Transcript_42267/m.128223 type:complete len:269 (-) Transcript_42267:429-1235(-)
MENSLSIEAMDMTVPTYSFIMIDMITSTTEEAMRSLVQRVKNIKITNLVGEDIDKAASQLRDSLLRLKPPPDHTPVEIVDTLIEVFQTSSVDDFKRLFETLKYTLRLSSTIWTTEKLIALAETTCKELVVKKKWTGAGTEPSDLALQCVGDGRCCGGGGRGRGRGSRGQISCWKFGGNHMKHNCPLLQGGGGNDGAGKQSGIQTETNPLRRPPGKGQPCFKIMDGVQKYWCGVCNLWNPTHDTDHHVRGFKQKEAKLAASEPPADMKA